LIGMLSLAGLPFTAGFLGKFFIFSAAISHRQITLIAVGVIAVGCGFYYYLRVVRAMYWPAPTASNSAAGGQSEDRIDTIPVSGLSRLALSALIVATVWLGIYPQPILDALKKL